jgi:thioredoxin 1
LPLAFSQIILGGQAFLFPRPTQHRGLITSLSPLPLSSETNTYGVLFSKAVGTTDDSDHDGNVDTDRSRPKIVKIQTHQEYLNFLEEDDRLCVVKFYASWCKSCKRFGISYRQLAFEAGDHIAGGGNDEEEVLHSGKVRFAEVEYSQNARLCKSLKIKKLPTVHYYKRGVGKLSELTCKPSQFQLVVDKMNHLLDDENSSADAIDDDNVPVVDALGSTNVNEGTSSTTQSFSFDEAVANLSQEIMDTIQTNQTSISSSSASSSGRQEKNRWFPF